MAISTIFYSWQSDLPHETNLDLIENSLVIAVRAIKDDESISVEPVVDRDTLGIPGAPDIAATIFEKIENSDVFVCDISIITQIRENKHTPNPNVLIELGYALKTHGFERIILVMNSFFGSPDQLPFDLRSKRVVVYDLPPESDEIDIKTSELSNDLEESLKMILAQIEIGPEIPSQLEPTIASDVIQALEENRPNQVGTLRKYLARAKYEIDASAPEIVSTPEIDDVYIEKLEESIDLVESMLSVYQVATMSSSQNLIMEIYKSYSSILEGYRKPLGFSGTYSNFEFDFHRFLGHELFVSFFSFLIADLRWDEVSMLLENELYVENTRQGTPGLVPYYGISDYVEILNYRNKRLKLKRRSLHADLLQQRHSDTPISNIVPHRQLMDADLFFYLREGLRWRPWSSLYLGSIPPRFLVEATSKKNAEKLLIPLQLNSIDELRSLVGSRIPELRQLYPHALGLRPLEYYEPRVIGSR